MKFATRFIAVQAAILLALCWLPTGILSAQQAEKMALGIAKEKPANGPFVKIEGGYMVPYKTMIPGTEIPFEMIPVPGGEFVMGSPEDEDDRRDDEGPQTKVAIKPFWIGKYEVTWKEYQRYMAMEEIFKNLHRKKIRMMLETFNVDAVTAPSPLYKPTHTYEAGEGPDEPAATMSQYAAKQYTKWLSRTSGEFYRLPFEAEWEYACRAGTTTAFYFGDDASDLEEHAWYSENSDEERHDVGQLKPNPWGLYDMYGNVAEWVLDSYDEDGYTHIEKADLVPVEKTYREPEDVYYRVARGGSFELEPEDCRSAARIYSEEEWKTEDPNYPQSPWWYTDFPGTGVGFRLVRPLEVPQTKEAMDKFWRAKIQDIEDNARDRVESHGKGSLGVVDPSLTKDIETLESGK